MSKANRFDVFAVEEESSQQQTAKAPVKQAEVKKKPVVKVAPKLSEEEQAGFEKVDNGQDARRGARGGRGGERGDRPQGERRGGRGGRGGDRPQGERRERPEGEERRGGERGGRGGRGGRGRGRPQTAGLPEDENAPVPRKERRERGGQRRHEGKPGEEHEGFDRTDGTGRGRRERKPWTERTPKPEDTNVTPGEGEAVEAKPERERRERKPREEVKAEVPEVVEEVGFTLDDYIKAKQAKSQGLIKKQEVRKHEAIADKKIEESKLTHDEMAKGFVKDLPVGQTYAVKKGEGAELLGFGFKEEEEFESRRGGRGGRGGDRPQTTANRGGRPTGGRKGGKLVVDDNDFPAL